MFHEDNGYGESHTGRDLSLVGETGLTQLMPLTRNVTFVHLQPLTSVWKNQTFTLYPQAQDVRQNAIGPVV